MSFGISHNQDLDVQTTDVDSTKVTELKADMLC